VVHLLRNLLVCHFHVQHSGSFAAAGGSGEAEAGSASVAWEIGTLEHRVIGSSEQPGPSAVRRVSWVCDAPHVSPRPGLDVFAPPPRAYALG